MAITCRRDFLKALGAGAAAMLLPRWLAAAEAAPVPAAAGRKPNIVYILADDIGYGDVGCYGATKVKTPNIDRLAKEGVRFSDAHAVSAVCTPSRYGLLTGEYGWRVNSWGPHAVRGSLIIDPAKMTLARLLKNHGYATACIGKWHLGFGATTPDWNGDLKRRAESQRHSSWRQRERQEGQGIAAGTRQEKENARTHATGLSEVRRGGRCRPRHASVAWCGRGGPRRQAAQHHPRLDRRPGLR